MYPDDRKGFIPEILGARFYDTQMVSGHCYVAIRAARWRLHSAAGGRSLGSTGKLMLR
jgi:hypothetical protein